MNGATTATVFFFFSCDHSCRKFGVSIICHWPSYKVYLFNCPLIQIPNQPITWLYLDMHTWSRRSAVSNWAFESGKKGDLSDLAMFTLHEAVAQISYVTQLYVTRFYFMTVLSVKPHGISCFQFWVGQLSYVVQNSIWVRCFASLNSQNWFHMTFASL